MDTPLISHKQPYRQLEGVESQSIHFHHVDIDTKNAQHRSGKRWNNPVNILYLVIVIVLMHDIMLSFQVRNIELNLLAAKADILEMKDKFMSLSYQLSDNYSSSDDDIYQEEDGDEYQTSDDIDTNSASHAYRVVNLNADLTEGLKGNNSPADDIINHLSRKRRDTEGSGAEEVPKRRHGEQRRDRKDRNKKGRNTDKRRKKLKSRRNRNAGFIINAAHMRARDFPTEVDEEVRDSGEVSIDCGMRTKTGVQVHCKRINLWTFDSAIAVSSEDYQLANGVLVIEKPGIYYVYSQITHHDVLGSWSYAIIRIHNGEEESLAQCPGMEPHYHKNEDNKVYAVQFQCHTSRAVRLNKGDQLFIENQYYLEKNRVMRIDPPLSFWGIMRLAP